MNSLPDPASTTPSTEGSPTPDFEVAVVGGGLAGLTAAAFAARSGARVVVLERSTSLGGRAGTRDDHGFLFNMGPHALYDGGPASRALAELGVRYSARKPPTSGGLAFHQGGLHALPAGPVSLLTTDLLGLGAKLELARVLGSLPKIDAATLRGRTLAEWLRATVRDDAVRGLVEALMRLTTYANDPTRSCAAAAVAQLQAGLGSGVLYVDGGWQTLVASLREQAERAGVRFVTGARAKRVRTVSGGVEIDAALTSTDASGLGVEVADAAGEGGSSSKAPLRTIRARIAILAVPPAVASALVDGPASAVLEEWAAAAMPVKAACLDLGLRRLPRPRRLFVLGIDRPFYFSVHSASARLAPDGASVVHVAKYLPPGPSDAKEVERELEAFCEVVQPGWRNEVVARNYLPSMVVTGALVSAGSLRPGPQVPGSDELLVAGDWVGDESMIADAAVASGRKAGLLAASRGGHRVSAFAA